MQCDVFVVRAVPLLFVLVHDRVKPWTCHWSKSTIIIKEKKKKKIVKRGNLQQQHGQKTLKKKDIFTQFLLHFTEI